MFGGLLMLTFSVRGGSTSRRASLRGASLTLVGLSLLGLLASRTAAAEPAAGQPTRPPDPQEIRPLLARYCLSCHGDKDPRAGLNLKAYLDREHPGTEPRMWKPVWDRLRSRRMPPPNRPQPTGPEREQLLAWIEGVFATHTLDGHPDPGPLPPRRLNVRVQMNSLHDLAISTANAQPRRVAYTPKRDGSTNLYQAIIPPPEHPCSFVARILPQDTSDGGFDTIGDNLSIPPFLMEKYLRCSKVLLDDLFTLNPRLGESSRWPLYNELTKLQKGPPRGQTARQALTAFLRQFAGRAFRRPVTAEEVEKYARLFDQSREKGDDFETAIRLPLQAILVSPRFLVLWGDAPAGERDKTTAPVRPLDDHELAARLATFLWSSLPDRELSLAAQEGRLHDPKVLEQQVRRMLHDRRITDGLLVGFLCQWLQLERLDRNAPDADRYPAYFQNNLGELMKQELLLFTDAILVEDRSILEFLDADWGFLCYPLARHYGYDNFPGKQPPSNAQPPWYRVRFADKRRGGVLTMGKVLTGTSQPARTSPVRRGKWVLETILGTPPPPPPPDVNNQLKEEQEAGKDLTVPQLLARHRSNPACSSCHQMIDPLGLAFESFDPVGRWRDRDQDQPIDTRGTLLDGKEFNGVGDLKALLVARKDEFVRGFVEQMLAYALGRKLDFYDVPTVKQIAQAVTRDEHKFSRVVVEVALSYPFQHRRATGAGD
jgi:hypothetical protein